MTDTSAELGAESVKRDRLTLALLAVSIFLLPFLVTVACLVFSFAHISELPPETKAVELAAWIQRSMWGGVASAALPAAAMLGWLLRMNKRGTLSKR